MDQQQRKHGDTFKLTITCPVCLTYYKTPIQFPSCSHSLCQKCMLKLPIVKQGLNLQDVVQCPSCRVTSVVGAAGIKAWPTNSVIQQIVEMVEAQENVATSSSSAANDEPLPNPNLPDFVDCDHFTMNASKEKCPHCKKLFCNSCKFLHMEILRERTRFTIDEWAKRYDSKSSDSSNILEERYQEASSRLGENFELVKAQVHSTAEMITALITVILHEKADALLAEAEFYKAERLTRLRNAISMVSQVMSPETNSTKQEVDQFLHTSVTGAKLTDVSRLYKTVMDTDKELKQACSVKEGLKSDMEFEQSCDLDHRISQLVETNISLGSIRCSPLTKSPRPSDTNGSVVVSPQLEPGSSTSQFVTTSPSSRILSAQIRQTIPLDDSVDFTFLAMAYVRSVNALVLLSRTSIYYIPVVSPKDQVVTPWVFDPEHSPRQLAFYARLTTDGQKLFALAADRQRVISFDVLANYGSLPVFTNFQVIATTAQQMRGIAVLPKNNEICTIIGEEFKIMRRVDANHFETVDYSCKVLSSSRIVAGSDEAGAVYVRANCSGKQQCHRVHLKRRANGSVKPWGDPDGHELAGINIGEDFRGTKINAEFDSRGNLFIMDDKKPEIKVLCRKKNENAFGCRGVIAATSFAKAAGSIDNKSADTGKFRPVAIAAISSSESGHSTLAVADFATKKLLILELPGLE